MKGGLIKVFVMNNILAIISIVCTIFNSMIIFNFNKKKIKSINRTEVSENVRNNTELSTKVEIIIRDISEIKSELKSIDKRNDEMSNQIARCEEKIKNQELL